MNYKRANLEICKNIINGELIRAQISGDGSRLFIDPEGHYGYFINRDDVAFSMDKVRVFSKETRNVAHLEDINPENEIKPTDFLRIIDYRGKRFARKFEAEGKETWIQCDYMKNLDIIATKFYQKKESNIENVIAVEDGVPVMVLLPIRVNEY